MRRILAVLSAVLPLTIAASAFPLAAQSAVAPSAAAGGTVSGRVVSANGALPIATATIELRAVADSTSAARASTRADGTFRIASVAAGRYRALVRALGFTPRTLTVAVTAAAPEVDLGVVALASAPVELQRMTVSEEKRAVELAPDRNTYDVHDMPTTRGGTALDVLRNVPSVDVDMDNVVSLRGDAGVVVQINGRPSPMKPAQLGNFLAQLPADMVAKVEVIPNPSARDNPEGSAGIINIVLKQEAEPGASGGLTLTGGTTGRAEVGTNLGWEHRGFSFYGSYGFMRDSRPRRETIYRENLYDAPLTYLDERGARTQIPLAHTLTGNVGYRLGKHDELSADAMFSTRRETGTNSIFYRDLDASQALTGVSDRSSRGVNHESNLESTLAYKHAFDGEEHELASELRVFRGREGGPNRYTTQAFGVSGDPAGDPAYETTEVWEHPDETSFKTDYTHPFGDRLKLGAGYRGSLQQFHTTLDTRVLDSASAAYVADPTRTSDFDYDERVHAGYAMLTAGVGTLQLQGGLRVERAATRFHLNGTGLTYDNRYASVFPSALVAYAVDDADQVKLSYSTRIWRPDDTDLIDPTPHYQDPLNLSRGNPYLQPQYIRALELGLQRTASRATMQVTPFYRHTLDAVRRIRTIDTAGVTTTTFANVATTDAYGTDATVALHGGRVAGFVGASAFRQVSNAANLAPGLSARTFGWTARTNATYHATRTLDLQTLLFYRGPMTVEQGRMASQARVSLAARQKLQGDRVNLTLRVIDPFRTDHERMTTIDPRFYQISDRRRSSRGVLLSVTWNFGAPPKEHGRDDKDPGPVDAGP